MRIRNQLVGLLVGVLALGATVAVFPSGASGSGKTVTAAGAPTTVTVRCNDAKKLQTDQLAIIGNSLPKATLAAYKAKLQELVDLACSESGTCLGLTVTVSDLVKIRGTRLTPVKDAQLVSLEAAFRLKHCGS